MFCSFAQNAEDVRLARAFGGQAQGFYIDIGAAHPVLHSVTKHFYDAGWRGIDAEPDPRLATLLHVHRPRDIVAQVACSDHEGSLDLHETGMSEGWSTVSPAVAEHVTSSLGRGTTTRAVRAVRAITLWEDAGRPHVDFLKIDVEGHEREALTGCDVSRMRPRVLIVEATLPHRPQPTHDQWEDLVLAAGYLPAGFDGLNRWYVAPEEHQLIPALERPVSALDDYVLHKHSEALSQVERLQGQVAQLEADLTKQSRALHELESALAERRRSSFAAPPWLVTWVRRTAVRLRRTRS